MSRLLSRREIAIWTLCFAIVSVLLVVTRFASDDPDSALYAALSERLAAGPPSHWIAPQWWGHWDMEGWFREHPIGVMALPTLLGAIGVPAVQAAYIVGIAAGLAALLLIASLVSRLTSRDDARIVLVLLQLMPMASIFRIRANHEYPMLVCLLVALVGFDAVRRSWRWWWIAPVALTAGLLVKGVFVALSRASRVSQ
jgi:4-amino-4-deoxy-L-arabinose transferase-like glycosyltransferase